MNANGNGHNRIRQPTNPSTPNSALKAPQSMVPTPMDPQQMAMQMMSAMPSMNFAAGIANQILTMQSNFLHMANQMCPEGQIVEDEITIEYQEDSK